MSRQRLRRRQWKRIQQISHQAFLECNENEDEAIEMAKERVGVFVELLLMRLAIELVVYVIKKRFFGPESELELCKLEFIDDSPDEAWDDE